MIGLVCSLYLLVEPRPRHTDHLDAETKASNACGLASRGTGPVGKKTDKKRWARLMFTGLEETVNLRQPLPEIATMLSRASCGLSTISWFCFAKAIPQIVGYSSTRAFAVADAEWPLLEETGHERMDIRKLGFKRGEVIRIGNQRGIL